MKEIFTKKSQPRAPAEKPSWPSTNQKAAQKTAQETKQKRKWLRLGEHSPNYILGYN